MEIEIKGIVAQEEDGDHYEVEFDIGTHGHNLPYIHVIVDGTIEAMVDIAIENGVIKLNAVRNRAASIDEGLIGNFTLIDSKFRYADPEEETACTESTTDVDTSAIRTPADSQPSTNSSA